MAVVIETTLGDITVDLYLDQRPVTCLNFLKLCKMKYYNFNLFHTIRGGFIAQTGDPTGEGSGGQSIWGILEGPDKRFLSGEKLPKIRHTDAGLLSMVCTGDMMVGSQFFITLAPDLNSLDGTHCVIGEVSEGHEVLTKLNEVICDESHRPYRDVRITHTVVLEDPFNDPPGLRAPSRSPSPNPERLKGGRIAPDEEIDETQGKSSEEIQEMIEEKEAKARATILEIVGDLPDADIAPPENVLFVCKLNPVTTDEDLEIIFSRFGKIVSCEVIRDKKTGNSLQYAFIEFENKKSCEDAYFKMDNVLIDDRRIHVDFSQSVSKMRWLGKGRGVQYFDEESKKKSNNEDKGKERYREKKDNRNEMDNQSNGKRNHSSKNDKDRRHRSEKERDRQHRDESEKDRQHRDGRERDRQHKEDRDRDRQHKEERDRQHRDDRKRDKPFREEKEKDLQHRDDKEKDRQHRTDRERHRQNRDGKDRVKQHADDKQKDRQYRNEKEKTVKNINRKRSRSRSNIKVSHSHDKTGRKHTEEIVHDRSRSPKYKNDHNENNHFNSYKSKSPTRRINDKLDCKEKTPNDQIRHHKYREIRHHEESNHRKRSTEIKIEKDRQYLEPKTPSPVGTNTKHSKQKNDKINTNQRLNKKRSSIKRRKPSTSSDDSSESTSSSSDSSSSSESDNRKKKLKRRKRKYSTSSSSSCTSSSSSSSSSSDSSSESSSSSDCETAKKKHKKKPKQSDKKLKKRL